MIRSGDQSYAILVGYSWKVAWCGLFRCCIEMADFGSLQKQSIGYNWAICWPSYHLFNICWSRSPWVKSTMMLLELLNGIRSPIVQGKFIHFSKMRGCRWIWRRGLEVWWNQHWLVDLMLKTKGGWLLGQRKVDQVATNLQVLHLGETFSSNCKCKSSV